MLEGQMQRLWAYIEDQLYKLSPEIVSRLPPQASETLIEETEKKMHMTFSDEVKAFYHLHNGMYLVVDGWKWCSLKDMCMLWAWAIQETGTEECEDLEKAFPGEKYRHSLFPLQEESLDASIFVQSLPWSYHPQWIPFLTYVGGVPTYYITIDLSDERGGQMIRTKGIYSRKASLEIIAPSLLEYCTQFAEDLRMRRYHFDQATVMLWSQEGWAGVSEDQRENWRKQRIRNQLLEAVLALPQIMKALINLEDENYRIIDISLLPDEIQVLLHRFIPRLSVIGSSELNLRELTNEALTELYRRLLEL